MSVTVDKDALLRILGEIKNIDDQLDAASGTSQAGKRKFSNELKAEYAQLGAAVLKSITDLLNNPDRIPNIQTKIGVFRSVVDGLDSAYGKEIDEYLQGLVDAQPKVESAELSANATAELSEARKKKVSVFQAMKAIAEAMGEDVSDIGEVRNRRGSSGPKGPRVFGKFNFSIDGIDQSKTQNTLSHVAKALKFASTASFKEWLAEQGLNLAEPPVEGFEFLTADGKVFKATPKEAAEAESDDDDDEDDSDTE